MIDKKNDEWKDYAITAEDFIKSLHKDTEVWKKKHPILHKIDLLFKEKSISHYRASHALTHPWLLIADAWREVIYAWQRAFRGWDDTVIWSIDYHISEMLPVWMRELKKYKHGIPSMMFRDGDDYVNNDGIWITKPESMERAEKEWDGIMEKVAVGFESYAAREGYNFETKEEEAELTRKFEEGFDLLRQYWGCFWD